MTNFFVTKIQNPHLPFYTNFVNAGNVIMPYSFLESFTENFKLENRWHPHNFILLFSDA